MNLKFVTLDPNTDVINHNTEQQRGQDLCPDLYMCCFRGMKMCLQMEMCSKNAFSQPQDLLKFCSSYKTYLKYFLQEHFLISNT